MSKLLKRIRLGNLALKAKDRAAISDVLYSNQISPGPKVAEFERQFAALHDSKYGVMANSGTDALRIALEALKEANAWQDGDIVIVPSVTFVATINVVLQCRLEPMVVDVGMYDFNLNPWNLLKRWPDDPKKAERIKAILVAHLCGAPAEMNVLRDIAKKKHLKIIEDSCETMGVKAFGKPVGSWGDIGCFSFYVAHLLTTGVGGMCTTSDPKLERLLRSYMNHGRDPCYIPGNRTPALTRNLLQKRFRFERIGYSCRPTEFEAALGLSQLPNLTKMIEKRRQNANRLLDSLCSLPLALPIPLFGREHAYMMFPIVIGSDCKVNKWDLCLYLEKAGIETRELLPLINQPCYQGRFKPGEYCIADWVIEKGFYVPCHQDLGPDDMDYIGEKINRFFRMA